MLVDCLPKEGEKKTYHWQSPDEQWGFWDLLPLPLSVGGLKHCILLHLISSNFLTIKMRWRGVSSLWPFISGRLGCGYVPESQALPWPYFVGARSREMCREAPVSSWCSRRRAEFNLLPSPSLVLNGKRTLLEHRFLGQHFQCTFCVTGAWETVFPVLLMLLAQWPWLIVDTHSVKRKTKTNGQVQKSSWRKRLSLSG